MDQELNFEDYTLLIVDDNPINLGVIAEYLDEYGLISISPNRVRRAISKVVYAAPDLILLDVMMPGINGFETCRRLQSDEKSKDIPVIFMTALASEDDKVKGFEVGGVDYVIKPVQQREGVGSNHHPTCGLEI